jgi:hypothetical protein
VLEACLFQMQVAAVCLHQTLNEETHQLGPEQVHEVAAVDGRSMGRLIYMEGLMPSPSLPAETFLPGKGACSRVEQAPCEQHSGNLGNRAC